MRQNCNSFSHQLGTLASFPHEILLTCIVSCISGFPPWRECLLVKFMSNFLFNPHGSPFFPPCSSYLPISSASSHFFCLYFMQVTELYQTWINQGRMHLFWISRYSADRRIFSSYWWFSSSVKVTLQKSIIKMMKVCICTISHKLTVKYCC